MLAGPCYIPYGTLPNVRGMRVHFTTVDRMPVGGILHMQTCLNQCTRHHLILLPQLFCSSYWSRAS